MAQSRLEKIGTIFTRVTSLLRSGAMKSEDKPIWYNVYTAFPPKLEPSFDRPASNVPIRKIFYEEDIIRAKYQKSSKPSESINLNDTKHKTQAQQFIQIYNNLKSQGALDDQKIFETAQDLLAEQRHQARAETLDTIIHDAVEVVEESRSTLLNDFKEATESSKKTGTKPNEPSSGSGNINISNLFKD